MRTIEQFMWGFQPHFRSDLEYTANRLLQSIGAAVAPVALLVGFEEEPGHHPICVEPENIGIDPLIFSNCASQAQEAYEAHPGHGFFMTSAELHERFHATLRDKCKVKAVAEVLDHHRDERRWFVGSSVRVERYRVFPVVGVLRSRWDDLPKLAHRNQDDDERMVMYVSLHEAVLRELLASASFALSISTQPQGLLSNDKDELVRRASRSFISRLVYFKGDFMGGYLDAAMTKVAAQPYEGRTGVGTLLLASEADYSLDLAFEVPIELTQTRALRKALEMTDSRLHVVTDGNKAFGLGKLRESYQPETESAFALRVIGRGAWELEHAGTPLLTVTDGEPSIPRERLSRSSFAEAIERLFGKEVDAERLWNLAIAASEQAHGTMLVIRADADREAERLSPPAMRVSPGPLSESTLLAVSAIDGAILVDPLGECHAIGVILDGRAAGGVGDISRGARFNSAHRYLTESDGKCLIVIVSEDGMLNLIPDLPRRLKKSYVENVLVEVENLSRAEPVDFEAFHKREEHLRSLAFYLSAEQCERANEARERVEQFREASFESDGILGGITRVGYERLAPDSRLDDSFFLPDVS